ncbi:MAG: glycosyltransferase family 2 protein [Paludibacter sp.]|nr:glycosyltransferase family 2 protein [Paludibacter sp.]
MKVSIITIVYNNQACIAACIQSVQDQTYNKIEHIVIDGGSTDGTQEEIEPFRDKLAYYKSEKDKGLYYALNKGIQQATGDIIGILHSDDLYYEHDTVQKIVEAYKKSGADMVYANGLYVDKTDTDKVMRIYPAKPFRSRYLHFGWVPLHTTIYVRREMFQKYGMYDIQYDIASDYEISLRWLTNKKIKTYFLNACVVKMRLGGKSTSASLQKKKSLQDLQIINKYKLEGAYTLGFKIARKIPQYIVPRLLNNSASIIRIMMLIPRGKVLELQEWVHRKRTGRRSQ